MNNISRIITLMDEADFLEEQVGKATELMNRISASELMVTVIGQFKRGKSSLINAMLGSNILPVGIVPLTAAVTEIRHGSQFHAIVRFEDGIEQSVIQAELPEYISEQENSDNHKRVSLVSIWTPMELFGSGVLLVDTPGVGSVHRHNTETSLAFVEKSDAILFLLSVDSPVSETERDFLLHSREYASKFYFSVNKVDTISPAALDEFIEYSTAILSKATGIPVNIYPVSAKTGAGIETLIEKIAGDIRASHGELLSASIELKLHSIINQAVSKIGLFLKAAAIPTDELSEKLSALREKQLTLTSLADEFQILTQQQVQKLLVRVGEYLNKCIAELKPELLAKANHHYEELKELPSRRFEEQLSNRIESDLQDVLTSLNEKGLAMLREGYADIIALLNNKSELTASFVSTLLMEFFGVEYAVSIKEFPVSERNDYYINLNHNSSLFFNAGSLTHLLPKNRANAKVFSRALVRMEGDIERNKNSILYNYGYKMQESLRLLFREFAANISEVNKELNTLFVYVEQSHQSESEAFRSIVEKHSMLLWQLEEMRKDIGEG